MVVNTESPPSLMLHNTNTDGKTCQTSKLAKAEVYPGNNFLERVTEFGKTVTRISKERQTCRFATMDLQR